LLCLSRSLWRPAWQDRTYVFHKTIPDLQDQDQRPTRFLYHKPQILSATRPIRYTQNCNGQNNRNDIIIFFWILETAIVFFYAVYIYLRQGGHVFIGVWLFIYYLFTTQPMFFSLTKFDVGLKMAHWPYQTIIFCGNAQGSSRTGTHGNAVPVLFFTQRERRSWHQLEKRLKMRIKDSRNKKLF